MSWKDDIRQLPSRHREQLTSLLGKRIRRLAHAAWEPLDELLATPPYAQRHISAEQMFSCANGPAMVEIDEAPPLGVGWDDPLQSLTIDSPDEYDDDAIWIEATDVKWSEPRFAAMIGRAIDAVRLIQRTVVFADNPKLFERPREAGLIFTLDDGAELLFAHNLLDKPNDFAVLTGAELPATGWSEIWRVSASG